MLISFLPLGALKEPIYLITPLQWSRSTWLALTRHHGWQSLSCQNNWCLVWDSSPFYCHYDHGAMFDLKVPKFKATMNTEWTLGEEFVGEPPGLTVEMAWCREKFSEWQIPEIYRVFAQTNLFGSVSYFSQENEYSLAMLGAHYSENRGKFLYYYNKRWFEVIFKKIVIYYFDALVAIIRQWHWAPWKYT
jgi:hypothetical protein